MKLNSRKAAIKTAVQLLFIPAFFIFPLHLFAQTKLQPGFDKAEYAELFHIHVLLYDTTKMPRSQSKFIAPKPVNFKQVYSSPIMGMDNKWELWRKNETIAAINVRGTTQEPIGWLENFYAAMVPAAGVVKLTNDYTFKYKLAENPRATVHIGWLVGAAFLARDIVPKIDSAYQAGTREFLIMGHSQGGALVHLLTAHFHFLQKQGTLPRDIRFKTYASASPKVGNTYFAYEYENMIAGGWGYSVINAADWVPEVPFTVQTLDDFNETNPFKDIDAVIGKQKLLARVAMRHAYKKMRNPSLKAQRNYNKYLGKYASGIVRKHLPEFEPPVYAKTSNYVRTSPTIMLLPDEAYYKEFPDSDKQVFIHHLTAAYLYLLEKYPH